MMIVDHIAAGVLLPHARKKFQSLQVFGVSVLAAILPDVPVIFSGGAGSIGYLSHRAATHSFVLAPAFSLVPVILAYLVFRKKLSIPFFQLYIVSLSSYCIHIFMDLITPFGTKTLFPLKATPFSLDLLHSFDPIFMAISLSVIILFIRNLRRKKWGLSAVAVAIVLLIYSGYGISALIRKYNAAGGFARVFSESTAGGRVVTIPRTFWRWKGIAIDKDEYHVAVYIGGKLKTLDYPRHPVVPRAIRNDDYYQKFMEYARFPVLESREKEIGIHNLVYSEDSYRLIYRMDRRGIREKWITGFNIPEDSYKERK